MTEINGVSLPFMPIGGFKELNKKSLTDNSNISKTDFKKVFEEEFDKLKFSAHAQSRMTSRDISLDTNEIERLNTAVDKAVQKNVRESLILLNDKAFIVNIPNKTVITVANHGGFDNSIVTNIDSAVFA